jgi:hypothetical protein
LPRERAMDGAVGPDFMRNQDGDSQVACGRSQYHVKGVVVVTTVKVGYPNGAQRIPSLRFAPVGMTNRSGLLRGEDRRQGTGWWWTRRRTGRWLGSENDKQPLCEIKKVTSSQALRMTTLPGACVLNQEQPPRSTSSRAGSARLDLLFVARDAVYEEAHKAVGVRGRTDTGV